MRSASVSGTEAIAYLPQIVNYEERMEHKWVQRQHHDASTVTAAVGEKATRDEATLFSEEIKSVAQAVLQLCLVESSQSVSQSVGWSVGQSVSQQENASNTIFF